MRELSYAEALREAIREEMLKDQKVIIFGEDIGKYGGAYKVTNGLLEEFGPERVIDTPISEAAIVGFGIGLAIMGFKPIAEIMYMDFIPIATEQILNHAAKMHFMSGGQLKVPLVIRTQYSLGRVHGSQHSQFFPSWFMNIPGLLVALPSTPYDAKGLLKTAIRLEDPVLFIECCLLYHRLKGPVPEEEYFIPFGKADIKREGEDLTIVAISRMVHEALIAAEKLSKEGISIEVIDPRTLNPFDKETIIKSVKKTGRLIIASDDHKRAGVSSEISAIIAEEAIDYLDAPIVRVCSPDIPIPFSPSLEKKFMRNSEDIILAAKKIIGEA